MHTYCKNANILDPAEIRKAAIDCLWRKSHRQDTIEFFCSLSGETKHQVQSRLHGNKLRALVYYIELFVPIAQKEIKERQLILKPIVYREKKDGISGKTRRIGIQDVKQQIYDYLAVNNLQDILRRLGEYQCASIPGRGQSYGQRAIKRWLRNKRIRYAGKCDIQKCYQSIDQEKLFAFLRPKIKNESLMWFIETLVRTFGSGLSIGSYLSQFLCNLYLSELYHYISEQLVTKRKHRNGTVETVPLIQHVVFYMDDILMLGTNKKYMHRAVKLVIAKAKEMGLTIKPDWRVFALKVDDKLSGQFVDMIGVRFYHNHQTIRRRTFRRLRRTMVKIRMRRKRHKSIPLNLARRAVAYYGNLLATDSFSVMRKYDMQRSIAISKKVISHAESKIHDATAGIEGLP